MLNQSAKRSEEMKVWVRLDDVNPCMDYGKFCKAKKMLDKDKNIIAYGMGENY